MIATQLFQKAVAKVECNQTVYHSETANGVMWNVHQGDSRTVLQQLPENSFNCCVTSPPYYWLRNYGVDKQIGQEETVKKYIETIANIMDEVYRTLRAYPKTIRR